MAQRRFGERPQAPWHPLPLSELLIVAGAIGAVIGLRRGVLHNGVLTILGVGAVALGTIEVCVREHRSGYRSHTILLALLPVVVFHSAVVLTVASLATPPRVLNIALLVLDVALFALLFRVLRSRFLAARERASGRG